ncbi:MAG TPA: HAMP domain-containing sensor histidine kinase [Syntrophales bacterium]|nr:HAMP domain-containing sensor histidine kinase [Syntrophales bacterium]HPQ45207.1 HAMP domain-containing sensor histidine kinase [Syntrophales bacterium]
MKLTIFARLVIIYIIIFTAVSSITLFSIYQFGRLNRITNSILTVDNRMMAIQKALTDSLFSQMRYGEKGILTKDTALFDQFHAARDTFDRNFKEARHLADDETKDLLTKADSFYKQYQSLFLEEIEHLKTNQSYDEKRYKEGKEYNLNKLIDILRQLKEYSQENTYSKIRILNTAVYDSRSAAFFMMAVLFILGVIIPIIVTISIIRPLDVMKKKTHEIAGGNFEGEVHITSPPEIKELAEALNRMCLRLKEVDEMKTDFLSVMSHELRTPLTSIKEGATLLLDGIGGELTDKQKKLLDIILQEDKRMIGQVNSLLDLSKMEAGMMAYNYMDTSIPPLIRNIGIELESMAQAKDIAIKEEIDDGVPTVNVDAEKISQALRNLVVNAIKFTDRGGCVIISAHADDRHVNISVSDTGVGISREDMEKIFDKYHQVQPYDSKRKRGTGLGLAIVKNIIDAHGGTVWVESTLGEGSTFTFSLPL